MESKVIWTNLKMTAKYLEKIPIFLEISMEKFYEKNSLDCGWMDKKNLEQQKTEIRA